MARAVLQKFERMMDEKQLEESLTKLDGMTASCTNCGLCSETCATYQLSGWEHESPRGRIHLAAQFLQGRIDPSSAALSTFDRCLGCRACEPLCPLQVPYGEIRQTVQELRRQLHPSPSAVMGRKEYIRWITFAKRIGSSLWRRFASKWLSHPSLNIKSSGSIAKKMRTPLQGKPVLVFCCMQDLYQHDAIQQAMDFMERICHPVEIDKKQPCCGAIFERLIHGGEESIVYRKEREKAVAYQKKAKMAFFKWLPKIHYFLTQRCCSFLSDEPLLESDLYTLIETVLKEKNLKLVLREPKEVFYQPDCRSGQANEDPIWRLLNQITGLIVREFSNPHACCGGYCGESLLHPQHSLELVNKKIASLPERATLIVTSPDCWGAFKSHPACQNMTILYPIQLLSQCAVE